MSLPCECGACLTPEDNEPPRLFECGECHRNVPFCQGMGGCCAWCDDACNECFLAFALNRCDVYRAELGLAPEYSKDRGP